MGRRKDEGVFDKDAVDIWFKNREWLDGQSSSATSGACPIENCAICVQLSRSMFSLWVKFRSHCIEHGHDQDKGKKK